jgi:hypothetical protein
METKELVILIGNVLAGILSWFTSYNIILTVIHCLFGWWYIAYWLIWYM